METRLLGRSNLVVSRIGIGLTEVGKEVGLDDEARAERLLNAALDAGITFLDTAACYGWSKTWIGRAMTACRLRQQAAGGAIPGAPANHIHLALGFVLAHDEVDTAIVGSAKLEHVQANVAWLDSGDRLAPSVVAKLYRRFDATCQRG